MNELRHPVLLYDGVCGLCDGAVQFILARDRRRVLHFAPLQGAFAAQVLALHPELQHVDAMMLVQPATSTAPLSVVVRSTAVVAAASYMGGVWAFVGTVLRFVPRPVRDGAYKVLARSRFRVFGRRAACRVPAAEVRSRFLD